MIQLGVGPSCDALSITLFGRDHLGIQTRAFINSAMSLVIPFSLKTMESLQNGVATYFQATPLISMRTKLQSSSQSCRSVDGDAWCEQAITVTFNIELVGKISFKNIKFD